MTDWQTVQGSQENKPLEFDTESSQFYVYQRRNIHRVEVINENDDTPTLLWEYDERLLTPDEYRLYKEIMINTDSITGIEDALCELDIG